jgi:phosphohistidine phosphatase SixA
MRAMRGVVLAFVPIVGLSVSPGSTPVASRTTSPAASPATPATAAQPGPKVSAGDSVVVFLVRHAEKTEDGSRDPDLTPAGRARASLLARMLADAGLTGVYSTDYRRTRETAGPAARAAGLDVRIYDPKEPGALAFRLRSRPGRYLVVGHSNTVPGLVRALGGDPGSDIAEAEYDRLYVVLIGSGGTTTLRLHYGPRSGGRTMGEGDRGESAGIAGEHPAAAVPGA